MVYKIIIALITLMLCAMPVHSASVLGVAGQYNLFTFDSVNVNNSASLGRIAAGGDVNITYYQAGGGESTYRDYSLIAGGDLSLADTSIHFGGVFAGGNANINSFGIVGDVVVNGALTRGDGMSGQSYDHAGVPVPIDFNSVRSNLSSVSSSLAGMSATGITDVTPWNAITLSGHGEFNIFNVNGNDLNNATGVAFDIDPGSVAIVNVTGQNNQLANFSFSGASENQQNILFNYHEALALGITGIGVKGSILAPNADITFDNGHIDGTIVANSLSGTGRFNLYPTEVPSPVPLPAAVWLFASGVIVVSLSAVRKNKINT